MRAKCGTVVMSLRDTRTHEKGLSRGLVRMMPGNSFAGPRPVDSWCLSARGTVWPGQLLEPELVVPRGGTRTADCLLSTLPSGAGVLRRLPWTPCIPSAPDSTFTRTASSPASAGWTNASARNARSRPSAPPHRTCSNCSTGCRPIRFRSWPWNRPASTGSRSSTSLKATWRCSSLTPSTSRRCRAVRPMSRIVSGSPNCCSTACSGPASCPRAPSATCVI